MESGEPSRCCAVLGCRELDEDGNPVSWINTRVADLVFGTLVVLNAVLMGVDIEVGLQNGGALPGPWLFWSQFGFIVVFVFEIILRAVADGLSYFSPRHILNLLDTFIVVCAVAEYVVLFAVGERPLVQGMVVLRVFRLLRLLRVFRLLHIRPELYSICTSLALALRAVFWVFALLLVFLYICALACTLTLGSSDMPDLRDYFGSISASGYTHFVILTMEGYPSVVAAAVQDGGALWYFYFGGFILFTNVMLMNLVTGIICESVVRNAVNEEGEKVQWNREFDKFQKVVLACMEEKGFSLDEDMDMSFDNFKQVIRIPGVRAAFHAVDVCLDLEDQQLFGIIDEDGSGSLSLSEFFDSLSRLRSSKDRLHSLLVQADVVHTHQLVSDKIVQASKAMEDYGSTVCAALRAKLLKRFGELREKLEEKCKEETVEEDAAPADDAVRKQLHGLLTSVGTTTADARRALQGLEGQIAASRGRIRALQARLREAEAEPAVEEQQLKVMIPRFAAVQEEAAPSAPALIEPQAVLAMPGSPTVSVDNASMTARSSSAPPAPSPSRAQELSAGQGFQPPSRRRASMDSRRRLQERHQTACALGRAPVARPTNSRLLHAFHGHASHAQSLAKAATYESSSGSESGGRSPSPGLRRRSQV